MESRRVRWKSRWNHFKLTSTAKNFRVFGERERVREREEAISYVAVSVSSSSSAS